MIMRNYNIIKIGNKGVTITEMIISIFILMIIVISSFSSLMIFRKYIKEINYEKNMSINLTNVYYDIIENPNEYKYFRRIYYDNLGLEYPYETDTYIEIIAEETEELLFTIKMYKDNKPFPFSLSDNNLTYEVKFPVYEK